MKAYPPMVAYTTLLKREILSLWKPKIPKQRKLILQINQIETLNCILSTVYLLKERNTT